MRLAWITIGLAALVLAGVALWMGRYEYRDAGGGAWLLRVDRLTSEVCAISLHESAAYALERISGPPLCRDVGT